MQVRFDQLVPKGKISLNELKKEKPALQSLRDVVETTYPEEFALALEDYKRGRVKSIRDAISKYGLDDNEFRRYRNSEEGKKLSKMIEEELDEELRNLQDDIIDVLRSALNSPELSINLSAVNIWMKFMKKPGSDIPVVNNIVVKWNLPDRDNGDVIEVNRNEP